MSNLSVYPVEVTAIAIRYFAPLLCHLCRSSMTSVMNQPVDSATERTACASKKKLGEDDFR